MVDVAQMTADAAILLETGELVSYTIAGDTPSTIDVRAAIGIREDQDADGRLIATQTMTVLASAVSPKKGDTVVIRGRTCRVMGSRNDGHGLVEVDLDTGGDAP